MGARISTGKDNKQDYATPADFMAAVAGRFGPIAFDLAAHAGNAKSPNYFAPVTGREGPLPRDPAAFGMDSFDHSWAELSCKTFLNPHHEEMVDVTVPTVDWIGPSQAVGYTTRTKEKVSRPRKGLLWLNCEFNDIPRWTKRVKEESEKGANILSLTPASVGSVWFDELVAPFADVYLLRPRIPFIPGEPYNKDCMLSHFVSPSDRDEGFPSICTWNWKADEITHIWRKVARKERT
jgi:hypothetical protein